MTLLTQGVTIDFGTLFKTCWGTWEIVILQGSTYHLLSPAAVLGTFILFHSLLTHPAQGKKLHINLLRSAWRTFAIHCPSQVIDNSRGRRVPVTKENATHLGLNAQEWEMCLIRQQVCTLLSSLFLPWKPKVVYNLSLLESGRFQAHVIIKISFDLRKQNDKKCFPNPNFLGPC